MTRAGVADVAGMVDRIAESAVAGVDDDAPVDLVGTPDAPPPLRMPKRRVALEAEVERLTRERDAALREKQAVQVAAAVVIARALEALEAARAKFHGSAAAVTVAINDDGELDLQGFRDSLQAGNQAAHDAKVALDKFMEEMNRG